MSQPAIEPLDILVVGAHPDDAELFAGGTIVKAVQAGRRVGVLDLTRGEMGTRGTPQTRHQEAQRASQVLGVTLRRTLDLGDGDLANTQERRVAVAEQIRALRPRLVLTHHDHDRHPDHRRAHQLVRDACFYANVGGFPAQGERWLAEVAFFLGNRFVPDQAVDWVVDISSVFEVKLEALRAYATQFLASEDDPDNSEKTFIASQEFWDYIQRRARSWGHRIGVTYGEPYMLARPAHWAHPLVELVK